MRSQAEIRNDLDEAERLDRQYDNSVVGPWRKDRHRLRVLRHQLLTELILVQLMMYSDDDARAAKILETYIKSKEASRCRT